MLIKSCRSIWKLVLVTLIASHGLAAQLPESQATPKPFPSEPGIGGPVFGGIALGALGFAVGGLAGYGSANCQNHGDFCGVGEMFLGAAVGGTLRDGHRSASRQSPARQPRHRFPRWLRGLGGWHRAGGCCQVRRGLGVGDLCRDPGGTIDRDDQRRAVGGPQTGASPDTEGLADPAATRVGSRRHRCRCRGFVEASYFGRTIPASIQANSPAITSCARR